MPVRNPFGVTKGLGRISGLLRVEEEFQSQVLGCLDTDQVSDLALGVSV